jgi:hypothetical protein
MVILSSGVGMAARLCANRVRGRVPVGISYLFRNRRSVPMLSAYDFTLQLAGELSVTLQRMMS